MSGERSVPATPAARLTVLVPTRNESANVRPLIDRLSTAMTEPTVVLFVDDSDDDTPAAVTETARTCAPHLDVRLLHRPSEHRAGGLGGAVEAGLRVAETDFIAVMDGDLQHPPESLPILLNRAARDGADLVVASRYVAGGRNQGLGLVRTAVSIGSTVLAKVAFPRRLRGILDPMSGFFLVRRAAITEPLQPNGFKILLEIAVRHPDMIRCEVPFVFAEREVGKSKGTLREGLRFLALLTTMRRSLHVRSARSHSLRLETASEVT